MGGQNEPHAREGYYRFAQVETRSHIAATVGQFVAHECSENFCRSDIAAHRRASPNQRHRRLQGAKPHGKVAVGAKLRTDNGLSAVHVMAIDARDVQRDPRSGLRTLWHGADLSASSTANILGVAVSRTWATMLGTSASRRTSPQPLPAVFGLIV